MMAPRRARWLLVAACAAAATGESLAAGSVYVGHSPACSDAGAGTETAPLCSISAALKKARAGASDKQIVLRAGTFALTEAVHLTAADSGLTLRAYDGERVSISGGVPVTGWAESPAQQGIWSAPIPASCGCSTKAGAGGCGPTSCMAYSSPRQLYVNGRRANRTMTNASALLGWMSLNVTMTPPQTPSGVSSAAGGAYTVQKPASKAFKKGDMEFVYPAQVRTLEKFSPLLFFFDLKGPRGVFLSRRRSCPGSSHGAVSRRSRPMASPSTCRNASRSCPPSPDAPAQQPTPACAHVAGSWPACQASSKMSSSF
jgi:hypothetical protein